ncbi:MAG: haloacid dehalogenase type II [Sphingomonas sp.]|nr:haloacid dehalogenase type II [Sphingomonas sp.]
MPEVKVFAFDVFGTVVDWRSSIAREAAPLLAGSGIDPHAFADQWRARYQPAMEACRRGARPYTRLDVLNRETLDDLLAALAVEADEATRAALAMAWRRLDPWPDAVAGLTRIKARFPIVTLSNGNTALTLAMARRAGLPWDAILGAEATGVYKPLPGAYLGTADILGIAPDELCLVAAHHSDLAAARAVGLNTAYVARPMEYGGATAPDAHMAQDWDWSATSITDLASQIGA